MCDHRNFLLRQKGAFTRRVQRKHYSFIGPRVQYPPQPKRPIIYFAEGAETINSTSSRQQRLLCAGQVVKIQEVKFTVVALFWLGSKPQGKKRFSPRSELFVLLLPEAKTDFRITQAKSYYRAEVNDLLNPESEDPIVNQWICRQTAKEINELAVKIIKQKKDDIEWWERSTFVRTVRAQLAAEEEKAKQAEKRRATNARRRKKRSKAVSIIPTTTTAAPNTKRTRRATPTSSRRKKTPVRLSVAQQPIQPTHKSTTQLQPRSKTQQPTTIQQPPQLSQQTAHLSAYPPQSPSMNQQSIQPTHIPTTQLQPQQNAQQQLTTIQKPQLSQQSTNPSQNLSMYQPRPQIVYHQPVTVSYHHPQQQVYHQPHPPACAPILQPVYQPQPQFVFQRPVYQQHQQPTPMYCQSQRPMIIQPPPQPIMIQPSPHQSPRQFIGYIM